MSTVTQEAQMDLEAVCSSVAAGEPVDPEVMARVHERAERIRERLVAQYGVLDVAVDLIRAARSE